MENKKAISLVIIIIILVLGVVLFVGKLSKVKDVTPVETPPAPVAVEKNVPVKPEDKGETLPTVEMGNAVGVVKSISSDSLTVKTDAEEITLSIKGTVNVYAFAEKGTEQKSFSDVKVGSKVSVQYSQEKVVRSMYLLK